MTDSEHQDQHHEDATGDAPVVLKRRPATFEDLMKKRRREVEFTIPALGDDNEQYELVLRYRAIGSTEYDKLVAAYPPTTAQRKDGQIYNPETFAPALISAVSAEPKMTVEQATALLGSPDWAGGEVHALFMTALRLQNANINVPFTATD